MKEACRKNDRPPEYLLYKLIGTRLSSHDLLNLEYCHHQKFAVLIIYILPLITIRLQKYDILLKPPKVSFHFYLKKYTI